MKSKDIISLQFTPVLAIALFSLVIYANTLKNGFVYDDATTIVSNTSIKHLGNLYGLIDRNLYFSQSGEMTYRPVVTATYFLDYALYGLNPWGFHLTNILLHTINGVLLYLLFILIIKPSEGGINLSSNQPLLISLLFISHPVLTEGVNAISFREDLLMFTFYVTAFILYIKYSLRLSSSKRISTIMVYVLSCFFYTLALFSKEMAVTFPLVIILYEWLYSKKEKSLVSAILNLHNIGFIIITLVYLYIRFYLFYNTVDRVDPVWRLSERLFTLPLMLLYYVKITIFPLSLSADYNLKAVILSSFQFILSIAIILFILVGATLLRKKEHGLAFGVLFFGITLLPVYNIAPIGNPFAERYLYLPALGLACTGGLAIHRIAFLSERSGRFSVISIIIVLMFATLTVKRNLIWKSDYSLWTDTLKKAPNSARAHYGMGTAFFSKGMLDEAIEEYKASISIAPYYPDAFKALGLAYYKKGMEAEGRDAMAAASDTRGLINYYKKGLVEGAIIQYKEALKIDPVNKEARYHLAKIYHEQGMLDEAVTEYITLLTSNPDNFDTLNGLGLAFFQKGYFEKALSLYRKALDVDPESIASYNNIGMTYAVMGKAEEAEKWFEKGLQVDPESAESYYNLGFLYQNNGKLDKAIDAYKTAKRIRPDYEDAKARIEELEGR